MHSPRRFVLVLLALFGSSSLLSAQVSPAALTASALAGKTLNLTIEGGEAPFATSGTYTISLSASGNLYAQPAAGAVTASAGAWSHAPALPIADAVLTLGNYFSDGAPATLSLLDSGFYELNRANVAYHQYGHFTISTNSGNLPGTPPTILTQPANQNVDPGATATFSVSASAGTTLSYQWRKNGVEIAGATSATLSISPVAAADQASYTVVVSTSSSAVVSSAASLTITPKAPVITSQPVASSAYTGGSATFSVTATGFPEPTYQWQYYGTNISGATGATFTRSAVTGSHEGNYTVIVTNSQGSVTSNAAYLSIIPVPGSPTSVTSDGAATGTVNALLASSDGKLLIGGGFNSTTRPNLYRLNADGSLDSSFTTPLINGQIVTKLAAGPSGKIYIGGSFTAVGGTARKYLARLNADGSLDTGFAGLPSAATGIGALAVQADGKVVVAQKIEINFATSIKMTRLNTDGTVDATFNAGAKTIPGDVNAIAIDASGTIYLGGKFTAAQGVTRGNIATLTSIGEIDNSFDPGSGFEAASEIRALLFQPDGRLLVGGTQTSYNGRASKCLTRLFADGTFDSSFVPAALTASTTTGANSIALQENGKIVVGGAFAQVVGVTRQAITRLLPDGAVDPAFNPGAGTGANASAFVYAVAVLPDGTITLGGAFTTVAGQSRAKFASLAGDATTPRAPLIVTQPVAKSIRAGEPVTFTVLADGSPLAYQWRKNGVDIAGATFPGFSLKSAGAADAASYSVRVSNSSGAVFSSAAALSVDNSYVAGKLNASFVSPAAILNSVNAILPLANGKFLVGGAYTPALTSGLVRVNADGTLDSSFTLKSNAAVSAFAVQSDGKILIAGAFDKVGGITKSGVARLNSDLTLDTGFNYYNGPNTLALAVQSDGKIIVGGFSGHFTRLDSAGEIDPSFPTNGLPVGQVGRIIVQAGGKIIVGGNFSAIRGQSRTNFARLNGDGSLDGSFPASFSFTPTGVVEPQSTGKLLLATTSSGRIYRLSADGVVDESFSSTIDNTGNISKMLVLPGDRILGVKFTGTADGGPAYRFKRLDANGTLDTAFISEPGANDMVNALAATGNGRVIVGGAFTVLNAKSRPGGLAMLDVENPLIPVFSLQPLSRSALPGASTTFTASATGATSYQWKRNGVDLAGQTSATLTINPVSPSVTGSYSVSAINSEGSSTSSAATLAIAHPPVITAQPVSLSSPAGSNVTFNVSASSSVTPLTYQWRKDGTPMPGYTAPSFVLGGITSADAGSYDVIVRNADGSVTSNAATLTLGSGGVANFITSHGLDPATNGALTADPDGDGLTNLFEYIAGGNPTGIDGHAIPQTATAGTPPVFSYSFDRKHDAASLGLVIQYSDNLATWNEAVSGQNGVTISSTPVDAQTDRVTVSFPASGGKRFVHLSVP